MNPTLVLSVASQTSPTTSQHQWEGLAEYCHGLAAAPCTPCRMPHKQPIFLGGAANKDDGDKAHNARSFAQSGDGGGVAVFRRAGDMSRKCSPIVNINGVPYRQREREGGWERERNGSSPRPVLYHKERERRRVRIGRNVLGAPPAVVLDAVVK